MDFLAQVFRSKKAAFGPFKAHRASRVLTGPNGTHVLEPEVMELLFLLVNQVDEPVSREDINAHLWPRQSVDPDALVRCLTKLRLALGDDPSALWYIQTYPKGEPLGGKLTAARLVYPIRWGFAISLALIFTAAFLLIMWLGQRAMS